MFRKFISILLGCLVIGQTFPLHIFALSSGLGSVESYPGKMNIRSVNGLGKNISNDLFGGFMAFQYPFSFPEGSRGMTPNVELSYNSNNTDAFSPYGYGFSLSLPRIQRSTKKGVSELYVGDEYVAFGNDLLRESTGSSVFRSKDISDMNRYTRTGSGWIVDTPEGKTLTFGSRETSRIAHPESKDKIYAWLLEEEGDMFGHAIRYHYFLDGGQAYIQDIEYGFDTTNTNPIYRVVFEYVDKTTSLSSYRTQFEISTRKLLSKVSLFSSGTYVRSYTFEYDTGSNPISHLISIREVSTNTTLPKTLLGYGSGQLLHSLTSIDNQKGGKARFEYIPSTTYRTASGTLSNARLPFIVMTLSRQILEDSITGMKSEVSYTYEGGHYYYDSADFWGREYVGFAKVTATDEKTRKVVSFHQSQTADPHSQKYQDHIAKKGLPYKIQLYDLLTGKIFSTELTRYDMKTFGERRLIFPLYKIETLQGENTIESSTAVGYEYDDIGNLTREKKYGFVTANLMDATFQDIAGDEITVDRTYTSNISKNLYRFPVTEKIYGWSGELLGETQNLYDQTISGVTLGLLTSKFKKDIINSELAEETYTYTPRGLPLAKTNALGHTTSFLYDSHDIALLSTTNPLGWTTTYTYEYTLGKPKIRENQNGVKNITEYDIWGREVETLVDISGTPVTLSKTSYDDTSLPNSTTQTLFFTTDVSDQKTTKNSSDGWGRVISTSTSTEKSGQYSTSQIRYDDAGNPIYAGYPVFTLSDTFDTSLTLSGVTDGEAYRTRSPGMSILYDAEDRPIRQRDAKGVTTKSYTPRSETVTDALGASTTSSRDAYGNISELIEHIDGRDIITQYRYDALGRPTTLIDTYGNTRSWSYDGLGRLLEATDLHTPTDTTYGMRKYEYDALGQLTKYQNPKGETLNYLYDPLSRLTSEIASSGTLSRTYTYDAGSRSLGTLSSVTDTSSTVIYSYDPLGRKTSESRTIDGYTYTLGYTYNTANILTSIIYPNSGETEYQYRNGYIEGVAYTNPDSLKTQVISDISYAPNATMRSIHYANGVVKNTTRDADYNYRLMRATSTTTDGTKLLDTSYGYDAVSNITSISESGIEPLRKSVGYSYDPLARLTSASYAYGVAGYGRDQMKTLSYNYDDIGNMTNVSDIGYYNYSGLGYANPHAVTTAGGVSYGYDEAGQMISRVESTGSLLFSYSPYGEMLSSTNGGDITSYSYDHTRRRIVKSTPGLTEHHIIDGYEVEYESGALIPVVPVVASQSDSTLSGTLISTGSMSETGVVQSTGSLLSDTGTTSSGTLLTGSGEISQSGSSDSGSGMIDAGVTSTGETATGGAITNTGSLEIGTGSSLSGSSSLPLTDTGVTTTDTGVTQSSSGEISYSASTDSGSYIVIASYYAASQSGAIPITLTTTLTHIYLGDEKIATFQSQTDDTPHTPDDDQLIYHISDHLSSSSLDLSITGALLQATDYLPFGKTLTYEVTSKRIKGKKGGYKNKYLFANKQLDEETDLQYFEKRYYDNRIGRFTTEDPVTWEVGLTKRPSQYFTDPQQWNTYSYVRNNPINYTDPTGECLGDENMTCWERYKADVKNSLDSNTFVGEFTGNIGQQLVDKFEDVKKIGSGDIGAIGRTGMNLASVTPIGKGIKFGGIAIRGFQNLGEHFVKHGASLGIKTLGAYQKAAYEFIASKPSSNIVQWVRSRDGATLKFDKLTGMLGIVNKEGSITTFHKNNQAMKDLGKFISKNK